MTLSSRPYLLRALYDWMSDNALTPQILVEVGFPGVQLPDVLREKPQVMLNISLSATRELVLGDEQVSFHARFSGVSQRVVLPIESVIAIVARETEAVMIFGNEPSLLGKSAEFEEEGEAELGTDNSDVSMPIVRSEDNVVHVQFGRDGDEA